MAMSRRNKYHEIKYLISNNYEAYKQILRMLKKDPLILAEYTQQSDYQELLQFAALKNNVEAARAIFDVLKDEKTAGVVVATIAADDFLGIHHSVKDARYLKYDGEHPHSAINSPKMLKLFHDNGYEFDLKQLNKPFIEVIIDQLYKNNEPDNDKIKATADAAVAIGINLHAPIGTITKASPGMHALAKICIKYREDGKSVKTGDFKEFKLLAGLGVDFREAMADKRQAGFTDPEAVQEYLRMLASIAPTIYMDESRKNSPRAKEEALAACACGSFPVLLNLCVKRDKETGTSEEVKKLLLHLDPFWQQQYRFAIETTLTRAAPLAREASKSLATYVRDADVPIGKA